MPKLLDDRYADWFGEVLAEACAAEEDDQIAALKEIAREAFFAGAASVFNLMADAQASNDLSEVVAVGDAITEELRRHADEPDAEMAAEARVN